MASQIGDNSLIHSLLTTRIAETPTQKVPEVESPELESSEIEQEFIEEIKKEEPKPIDYTEYEEEPANVIEKPENISMEASTTEESEKALTPVIENDLERQNQRRKITAKWGVRLYDKFQGLAGLFAYDKLNTPEDYVNRKNQLLKKVYDGTIKEKEREELKKVNETVDAFLNRRSVFQEGVYMADDLKEDINELLEDILEVSNTKINPVWILVVLMLIQPLVNLITAFSHKMQYNTRF